MTQYDNTPTVVVCLVKRGCELLLIRRNNEPGKGLLGLPGGYHMRGETWQEAGCREVLEETGYEVWPENFEQVGEVVTDEYGNNLIIATAGRVKGSHVLVDRVETQEVLWVAQLPKRSDFAFPRHYEAAKRFFNGS